MLALIEGIVINQKKDELIIKTQNGVGYELFYANDVKIGERITLFTSLIIRENSQTLYGFKSLNERNFFNTLLKVKGIGPKTAFNLMNQIDIETIVMAINSKNESILTKVSGIGKKAAARIILDLADLNIYEDSILDEVLVATKSLGIDDAKILKIYKDLTNEKNDLEANDLLKLILQRVN